MTWFDWLILILPVGFVMFMGFHCRRYARGVSDFLSAGRLCGRYVISMGDVANSLSIIGLVGYIEVRYKTGFSVGFWSSVLSPLWIVLGLTGYISYRFRETRAMSLGQFLEMRYSRRLRIAAAGLRSFAEIIANVVMPSIAARFFIQMLDLPQTYHILGFEFSTYVSLMILFLTLAISLICFGGTLALVITDTIQGMILYPVLAIFVVFLFWKFSVSGEIMPTMADRIPGESFINPYDISGLRDFNLFTVVIVAVYGTLMNRANWIGAGYSAAAKSPHEQKMAGLLGTWRNAIINVFYVLIAAALITFLNHKNFAPEANTVRKSLAIRAVEAAFKNDAHTRKVVQDAVATVQPQVHEIGVDPPLSQTSNLDTAFLDVIHEALLADAKSARAARPQAALAHAAGRTAPNSQVFPGATISQSPAAPGQPARASGEAAEHAPGAPVQPARASGEAAEHAPGAPVLPARASGEAAAFADLEGRANDRFQQVRTLYYQQNLSVTMRALLPPGLFGLFALLLFLAMLSTDDTRIYSAALTLAQDVVLPLRKKPFTPRGHIWMIRIVSIGIGVVFLAGSCWMKQMDYYNMFVVLICAMWEGGAGAIMTLGLYTRFGTTAGAWTAFCTSASMSCGYIFVHNCWASRVYPAIVKADLVEAFDRALRSLSSPFEPWIHWQMDAVRCPVNAIEFHFFLSVLCLILYVIVSLLTCRTPFNLDRMLHRGKYAVAVSSENKNTEKTNTARMARRLTRILRAMVGITPEYSRSDRAIAWGVFFYSFVYGFGVAFLGVVIWNAIQPWPVEWWSLYFVIQFFIIPCVLACFTTVWFGVGGYFGLRQLFRDLSARREMNDLDDGRVEGHVSLADKAAMDAADEATAAQDEKS